MLFVSHFLIKTSAHRLACWSLKLKGLKFVFLQGTTRIGNRESKERERLWRLEIVLTATSSSSAVYMVSETLTQMLRGVPS